MLNHVRHKRGLKQSAGDLQREDAFADIVAGFTTSLSVDRCRKK